MTLLCFATLTVYSQGEMKSTIVDGKKMGYKTFNLEARKDGDPVIVFETGLGGGTFDPILPYLPNTISGIQYERNGIGESELDPNIRRDAEVVDRLHNLLKSIDVKPPYLLVGHSIGGPYIRLFAARYPDDVCGLVFSDPTDFMLSAEENEQAKIKSGSNTGYRELVTIIIKKMSERKDFGNGANNDAMRALNAGYFSEYVDLPRLNTTIAATVIISYNKHVEQPDEELNKDLNLGINYKPWWKEYDDLRIQHYSDLIKDNDNSKIILLPKYSHGIYYQNPKLVADLIIENFNSYRRN